MSVVAPSGAPPPPPGGPGKLPDKPSDKPDIPLRKRRTRVQSGTGNFKCRLCKREGKPEDKIYTASSTNHMLRHLASRRTHPSNAITRRMYDRMIQGDLWTSSGLQGGRICDNNRLPPGEEWDGLPVTDGLDAESTEEEEEEEDEEGVEFPPDVEEDSYNSDNEEQHESEEEIPDAMQRHSLPLPASWQQRPIASAYNPPPPPPPNNQGSQPRNPAIPQRRLYPGLYGQPPSNIPNNEYLYESWITDAEYIIEHLDNADQSFTAVFSWGFVLVRRQVDGGQRASGVRLRGNGQVPARLAHLICDEDDFPSKWE